MNDPLDKARVIVALVFLGGLGLSLYLWSESQADLDQFIQLKFDNSVREYADRLQGELDRNLELVHFLNAYHQDAPAFSMETFQRFSKVLIRQHPSVQALEWIPRVKHEQRSAMENRLRNEGYPDFEFTERAEGERLKPALVRHEYYPEYYLYPLSGNELAHGFDLNSNPARKRALDFSANTGSFQTTSALKLVQKKAGLGFLAYLPVYRHNVTLDTNRDRRQALLGFMLGVYHIDSLMQDVEQQAKKENIGIYLFDHSSYANETLLYTGGVAVHDHESVDLKLSPNSDNVTVLEQDIHLPGRIWKLVAVPSPDFVHQFKTGLPQQILASGLLLSSLLSVVTFFAYSSTHSASTINKINRALDNQNQLLAEANQNLESFSYSVSHDLRSPLRAINGFIAILKDEHTDQLNDEGRRLFSVVQENAIQMSELINGILDFSRAGRMELHIISVDMNELVDDVWATLEHERNGRTIEFLRDELPSVKCDPVAIRQVWQNLFSNAIKFTRTRDIAKIQVSADRDGTGMIRYTVKDNGVGFNPDYSDKLFVMFARLHSTSEFTGTGVGLSLIKRYIQKHKGQIHGEGTVDGGASFTFSLPESGPF